MMEVPLEQADKAIKAAIEALISEGTRALKIEAGIEGGDVLAREQRRKTGRLAASTSVTGQRIIKHDPGAGVGQMPASRTELRQSAESTITPDPPGAPAHIHQGAGVLEGQEYGGYVERQFKIGQQMVEIVDNDDEVVRRAEKRALRNLRGRI